MRRTPMAQVPRIKFDREQGAPTKAERARDRIGACSAGDSPTVD